ncbi:Crp/Fnr family transcriptional regulator [Pseudonocardia asaccharolytica]|uniref:Crp/Fnr family transcriptional regulator n=1 Tax=Pseudonocardia asaccharolytica DSM 44247 = NBRC 16224 TaxID=1123024 RepID=A0A511CX01_9PSEU|nr:Crp/Fnr family transcriptional regulator [Pseudonocardia asaccharolytica]GEL16783.1 hypothetical protein PA7_06200 [Pseudonocardia asaccharolytica DSM 44247 = NBRC 16224]
MKPTDLPALRALDEPERSRLFGAGRYRRFARRETVFRAGDLGDCLYLILRGRVALRITTPAGDEVTLSLLCRGQLFGLIAVVDDTARRVTTAVALEPTHTLSVGREVLHRLRQQNPGIEHMLTDALAAHVRQLSTTVLDLLHQPVDKRVARRLADLTLCYRNGARDVEIPLTQDDVASLAGTTRATANRVLRGLEARGVLALSRGRITIADRRRLADAAR